MMGISKKPCLLTGHLALKGAPFEPTGGGPSALGVHKGFLFSI